MGLTFASNQTPQASERVVEVDAESRSLAEQVLNQGLRFLAPSADADRIRWARTAFELSASGTAFGHWVHSDLTDPPMPMSMNCTETIYFLALDSGLIDKALLRAIYLKALQEANKQAKHDAPWGQRLGRLYRYAPGPPISSMHAFQQAILAPLGFLRSVELSVGHEPLPGDAVFFGTGAHVALATGQRDERGRHGLWSHDNPRSGVRFVSLEFLRYSMGQSARITLQRAKREGQPDVPRRIPVRFATPSWAPLVRVRQQHGK